MSLTEVIQFVSGCGNLALILASLLQREFSGLDPLLQCLTETARKQIYTVRKHQRRSQNGVTCWAN